MKNHVIVVPEDKLIIVDGHALNFDFALPEGIEPNLHAIQWHEGNGHMEFSDDYNQNLAGQELYDTEVAPFVALWEAEKYRRDNPPPPTLAEAKTAKLAWVTQERDKREQEGFEYLGKMFDSDATSVQRLTVAGQAASLALATGQAFEIIWTVQDDTTITMTAEQMLGVAPAIAMHANGLHQEARAIKDKVKATTSLKKLEAIVW